MIRAPLKSVGILIMNSMGAESEPAPKPIDVSGKTLFDFSGL